MNWNKPFYLITVLLCTLGSFICCDENLLHHQMMFFIGYPGSGKGTQGKKLAEALHIPHLSTGELFRSEAKKMTPLGLKMDHYMQRGEIIPQELTFEYLKKELSEERYQNGFILDGYPKDLKCCEFILKILAELHIEPAIALYFDISREKVVERLTGRVHCKQCEKDYHKLYLQPQLDGVCDSCQGNLTERKDDALETINRRLDVFEANTLPVITQFSQMGILHRLDASKNIDEVTSDISSVLLKKKQADLYKNGSYFLRLPKEGKENSSIFHNHIDAESELLLREIVQAIESQSPRFQNKLYPISHLMLGPQIKELEFVSVYRSLPNFHPIDTAINEAFSTGKMGTEGFDYEQILITLEEAFTYPGKGVMTELEEEIYEKIFDARGEATVTLNKGLTPYTIDWSKLPGWQERTIKAIPSFELHHGFDIIKKPGEESLPIDLMELHKLTSECGFQTGGWFVFKKEGFFAYRCNEFSNKNFESCLDLLNCQGDALRVIVKKLLRSSDFTSSCSLEKVHAIWKI